MKHIWTKTGVSAGVLISGLALAGSAFAADASNSNTGADSDNDASVSIENDTTVESNNNLTINNTISVSANTGNNSADQNTEDGSVSSGDINGSVSILNTGNENGNFGSLVNLNCDGGCSFSASNSNTGANSDNDASVSVKNDIDVTVNNNADVDNNVGADLNTGGNSADKNTGDGGVTSGDINFDVTITNDLNKNVIGGTVPGEEPGLLPMPTIVPSLPAPKPGQVLAAQAGLPITGGLPSWPALLLVVGGALKIFEKMFRVRLGEE